MKIGVIGPGRIGGNVARQAVRTGHEVILSFSRDVDTLHALAAELGDPASVGTPAQAVADADVTILSVPWRIVDEALERAGPLDGRIIVDTTNQGRGGAVYGEEYRLADALAVAEAVRVGRPIEPPPTYS